MLDKPSGMFPLGLERDGNLLKGALLAFEKHIPKIERLFDIAIDPSNTNISNPLSHVQPPLPRDRLRQVVLVTGIPTNEVLIRPLDVKLTKAKDIDSVLAFQAEPVLPYPIETALIDRYILTTVDGITQLSLLAVKKDYMQSYVEQYSTLHIESEAISTYPSALANFSHTYSTVEGPFFLVHLGMHQTTCLLLETGKVLGAHGTSTGVDELVKAVSAQTSAEEESLAHLRNLNFDQVLEERSTPLSVAVETLRNNLGRTLYALTKLARGKEIGFLMVTGEGALIGNLSGVLSRTINKPLIVPTPPDESVSLNDLLKYAIPIGLALGFGPDNGEQVNFRKGEFSYPNPWKRLRQPLAGYVVGCLALAIAAWWFSSSFLGYQEDRIKKEYAELLNQMERSHKTFEREFHGQIPTAEELKTEILSLKGLSASELETRLNFLEKTLQGTPDLFPLRPEVPRVSDLLAWFSNHPSAVKIDPATGKRTALVHFDNFTYTMVKRPDKTKPKERYQVKVDLEFSSDDPKAAREFHDALVDPNPFVDPRSEVTWNAAQGTYRSSFFLKDKTVYP